MYLFILLKNTSGIDINTDRHFFLNQNYLKSILNFTFADSVRIFCFVTTYLKYLLFKLHMYYSFMIELCNT